MTLWTRAQWTPSLFWTTASLSALSVAAIGPSTRPWLIDVSFYAAGLSQGMFMSLATAMIQGIVSDNYRGRVNSLFLVMTTRVSSLAGWSYAGLAVHVSPRLLFAFMGVSFLAITSIQRMWESRHNRMQIPAAADNIQSGR